MSTNQGANHSPLRNYLQETATESMPKRDIEWQKNPVFADTWHVYAESASNRNAMAKDQNAASLEFLRTELETGNTFAKLALSAKYPDKMERNKVNARKAYDTALKFAASFSPDANGVAELSQRIEELRAKLGELGEAV